MSLVAACTSRYGTYLQITSDQKFDRIELYFGAHENGLMVPSTPAHRASATIATGGFVARRQLAETDVQHLAGPVQRFDYYLSDDADNAKLGDVVVAVAFAGQAPVAIGELRDFTVVGDQVWIYKLPLHAYDATAEVWGRPAVDCVRWLDPDLHETIAVVRGDDTDCDSYPDDAVDCDPSAYCAGSPQDEGCSGRIQCLVGPTTDALGPCAVGTCVNSDAAPNGPRQCTPAMCVSEGACDCIGGKPIAEEIACALDSPATHGADYPIVVKNGGALCHEPYEVDVTPPGMVDCVAPRVEAVTPSPIGDDEHFTFTAQANNGACHVTITPDMPGRRYQLHHLLISLDTNAFPRSTFIVGLAAGGGACQQPIIVVQDQSGVCPVP